MGVAPATVELVIFPVVCACRTAHWSALQMHSLHQQRELLLVAHAQSVISTVTAVIPSTFENVYI